MSFLKDLFKGEDKEKLKSELTSLEEAQKLLDKRYESHQVSMNVYMKTCEEFGKKKEKLMKKLGMSNYDKYN